MLGLEDSFADGGREAASRAAGGLRDSLSLSGTSGAAAPAPGLGQLEQPGAPQPARQPTVQSLSRNGGSEPGEGGWVEGDILAWNCHLWSRVITRLP